MAVGAVGVRNPLFFKTEQMKGGARSSLFVALSFPDSKKHPSTAAITKRHFESPADRSRIRTRNLMYYNRASIITWKCAPEIDLLINKAS